MSDVLDRFGWGDVGYRDGWYDAEGAGEVVSAMAAHIEQLEARAVPELTHGAQVRVGDIRLALVKWSGEWAWQPVYVAGVDMHDDASVANHRGTPGETEDANAQDKWHSSDIAQAPLLVNIFNLVTPELVAAAAAEGGEE